MLWTATDQYRAEPLQACVNAVNGTGVQVAAAASSAAQKGAEATKGMEGHAGRSGYVNASVLQGVPDPGAHAVAVWFQALAQQLEAE
jgi:triose/dihydroxyacetone kinase / FAD-AMP lyase (cyclizing)